MSPVPATRCQQVGRPRARACPGSLGGHRDPPNAKAAGGTARRNAGSVFRPYLIELILLGRDPLPFRSLATRKAALPWTLNHPWTWKITGHVGHARPGVSGTAVSASPRRDRRPGPSAGRLCRQPGPRRQVHQTRDGSGSRPGGRRTRRLACFQRSGLRYHPRGPGPARRGRRDQIIGDALTNAGAPVRGRLCPLWTDKDLADRRECRGWTSRPASANTARSGPAWTRWRAWPLGGCLPLQGDRCVFRRPLRAWFPRDRATAVLIECSDRRR